MANLIITVIAIALVGVAALMGAYYGGSAFMDGQAKAQANQLIETSKQIAGAWQLYTANNGGSYALTDYDWTDDTATDLVPNYVNSWPHFDFVKIPTSGGTSQAFYNYHPVILRLYGNAYSYSPSSGNVTTNNSGVIALFWGGISQKTCGQINLIATGAATIPNTFWAGYTNTATAIAELTPFRCVYSTWLGGVYYFIYRVF